MPTLKRLDAIRIVKTVGILLVMIHAIWALANAVRAYPCARPAIRVSEANRHKYANVVLLIDTTRSMHENDVKLAKAIAKAKIISSLGLGDILTVCQIGPTFGSGNCIQSESTTDSSTGRDELQLAEALSLLEEHRNTTKNGVGKQRFYDLLRRLTPNWPVVEVNNKKWVDFVDQMARPSRDGSNFCGALDVTEQVFATRLKDSISMDKILFVIGDLIQDGVQPCLGAQRAESWFSGVSVNLIYPLSAERDWTQILGFWGQFFQHVTPAKIPFLKALDPNGHLLRPNPFSQFRKDVPTYSECLQEPFRAQLPWFEYSSLGFALMAILLVGVSKRNEV